MVIKMVKKNAESRLHFVISGFSSFQLDKMCNTVTLRHGSCLHREVKGGTSFKLYFKPSIGIQAIEEF